MIKRDILALRARTPRTVRVGLKISAVLERLDLDTVFELGHLLQSVLLHGHEIGDLRTVSKNRDLGTLMRLDLCTVREIGSLETVLVRLDDRLVRMLSPLDDLILTLRRSKHRNDGVVRPRGDDITVLELLDLGSVRIHGGLSSVRKELNLLSVGIGLSLETRLTDHQLSTVPHLVLLLT